MSSCGAGGGTSSAGTTGTPSPSTTGGPVCLNNLCPGLDSNPGYATCAQVWVNGDRVFNRSDACVPIVPL